MTYDAVTSRKQAREAHAKQRDRESSWQGQIKSLKTHSLLTFRNRCWFYLIPFFGFTQSFVYLLGSLLHHDISDHHDVDARINKASKKVFGAPRDRVFSTSDVPERLKGKIYSGGVLAVLLYGCESWCLAAEFISHLRHRHNKCIREMCTVTMCPSFVHDIFSAS